LVVFVIFVVFVPEREPSAVIVDQAPPLVSGLRAGAT
jgi:hypothetical protein